jgi:hypothetical protein
MAFWLQGLAGLEGSAISVALGEWSPWQRGVVKAFDDSFIHEVWHNGTSDRYVRGWRWTDTCSLRV